MSLVQIAIPEHAQDQSKMSARERLGSALVAIAALMLLVGAGGALADYNMLFMLSTLGLGMVGGVIAVTDGLRQPLSGIRNTGIMTSSAKRRGVLGWLYGVAFTAFYVVLYWYPQALVHMVGSVEPLSQALRGTPADRWFLYGTLYTAAVLVMGVRMLVRYRHSKYQIVRTISVMFFQCIAAWMVPAILVNIGSKEYYFHYFWPLKYDYLFPSSFSSMLASPDKLVVFMAFWGVCMTFIATPVLTYFFGKRWYCSWVCGCGALAETLGDPWRQNSDKTLRAWRIERWLVHGVLLAIVVVTALVWLNSWLGGAVLGSWSKAAADWYGFYIGALFSGVIGVGFYPILGSRVWCRFGCPMAAVLGLLQKYMSRFRITVNGGQCISCGNCSTYCEMGIDVRAYAQRGQDVKRASCVGCGICAEVCPRGVLRLENR